MLTKAAFIGILTFSFLAGAHEETCVFEAHLKGIKSVQDRNPQATESRITAQVSISTARSAPKKLSYLDCKHWENEVLDEVEIHVPNSMKDNLSATKIVKIRYSKRKTTDGEQTIWELAE